jgi:hypothetical protein
LMSAALTSPSASSSASPSASSSTKATPTVKRS